MSNGKVNNGSRGLNGRTAFVVAVLSAAVGSLSGPLLLVQFGGSDVVAPDRFTGTEGAAIDARLRHVEQEIQGHLDNHPDQINRFDRRITALETRIDIMITNQQRMLDRLDRID